MKRNQPEISNPALDKAVSSFMEACKRVLFELARETQSVKETEGEEKDQVILKKR